MCRIALAAGLLALAQLHPAAAATRLPLAASSLHLTSAATHSPLSASSITASARPRARPAMSGLEPQDIPLLAGGALVCVGAVWLQVSQGGQAARASYSTSPYKADKPSPPAWWPTWLRLPEFDFVEVYGQEPSNRPLTAAEVEKARSTLERLYAVAAADEPEPPPPTPPKPPPTTPPRG
mmetsp:Transcript_9068/g.23921  ORF Transcript_9068/g.23921 Transcript_9068/m.23921 type:complete len:180 (+) Transcript_9068:182-721(+)